MQTKPLLNKVLTPLHSNLKYVKSKPFQKLLQEHIIEPLESNDKTDYLHEDGNISIDYIIRYINDLFMSGLSTLFEDEDEEDTVKNDFLYQKLNNRLNKINNILFRLSVLGQDSIKCF